MNGVGEESDDEWEEEQFVMVHLSGIIDSEYLKKCDRTNCKILGVDTEEPILQIDKMCFRGSYDDCIGTNIIFEEQGDLVNGKLQKKLKYMCHTEKNLDMIRVFIKREEDIQSTELAEESQQTIPQRTDENEREVQAQVATELQERLGSDQDNSEEAEVQLEMLTPQDERETENKSGNAQTDHHVDLMDCS